MRVRDANGKEFFFSNDVDYYGGDNGNATLNMSVGCSGGSPRETKDPVHLPSDVLDLRQRNLLRKSD